MARKDGEMGQKTTTAWRDGVQGLDASACPPATPNIVG